MSTASEMERARELLKSVALSPQVRFPSIHVIIELICEKLVIGLGNLRARGSSRWSSPQVSKVPSLKIELDVNPLLAVLTCWRIHALR